MSKLVLILIKIYSLVLSPALVYVFGMHCRFEVSCSRYTANKVREQGIVSGLKLGFSRLLSCHPWSKNYG